MSPAHHHHVINTSSPRHRHVINTSSPRNHHVITTSSPRHQHVTTTSSPHVITTRHHHTSWHMSPARHHHVTSTSSPRHHHVIITSSPRHHHIINTPSPRHQHTLRMPAAVRQVPGQKAVFVRSDRRLAHTGRVRLSASNQLMYLLLRYAQKHCKSSFRLRTVPRNYRLYTSANTAVTMADEFILHVYMRTRANHGRIVGGWGGGGWGGVGGR